MSMQVKYMVFVIYNFLILFLFKILFLGDWSNTTADRAVGWPGSHPWHLT